jgi:hypothetical protein
MSDEENTVSEHETPDPAPQAPAEREVCVIRAPHVSSGFVGPFDSREQAEYYLEAKRAKDSEGRWIAGKVEIVSAAQARRERENAEARELLGR